MDPQKDLLDETDLLDALIQATGLPDELIRKELLALIDEAQISPEDLNLQQLRKIIKDYLLKTLPQAKKTYC